jgi:hypothetical protein
MAMNETKRGSTERPRCWRGWQVDIAVTLAVGLVQIVGTQAAASILEPFVQGWGRYQRLLLHAIRPLNVAHLSSRTAPFMGGLAARRPHERLSGVLVPRRSPRRRRSGP